MLKWCALGSMTEDTLSFQPFTDALSEGTRNDVEPVDDDKMRRKAVRKDEETKMDSSDSNLRVGTLGHSQVLMSKNGCVNDEDGEMRPGSLNVLDSRFEIGDMVWGKVKSHPWWPGHLFNEAFATSSVRRSRRHGLILVAFFGDSSYGWFDPTELVPYDPHYPEKSQQTSSRNFVRAVEDSIDEASRRSALGLSCCCRNPSNFRPANVPGYVAVDVVDYEPGAIYSWSQIRKARDNFRPVDTLSFVKQLAVAPMSSESKNLDFVKNKASTLAYRRSKFEEFDETYAQAFTPQAVIPDKEPSRAPLSGPLVIADTLGGQKSSTKATKIKESSKKDRYLFKRRDIAADMRSTPITQGHGSSSSSSAYEDGTSDTAAAAYVLQKRDSDVSNDVLGETYARDQMACSAHAETTKIAPTAGLGVVVPSGSLEVLSHAVVDVQEKVPEKHTSRLTYLDSNHLSARDGLKKKKKKKETVKRPIGEQSAEKSNRPEKKMKKVKKKDGQRRIEHADGDSVVSGGALKIAVMPADAALSGEDSQASQWRKDNEATSSGPQQLGLASFGAGSNEVDLSHMLTDLRGLALNPVHGIERNGPANTRQFFLKFRSLVYRKSSIASTSAESELSETRAIKSTSASEPGDRFSRESSNGVSSLKLQKLSAKHEDPVKGRKRIPSERQEDNAAKRAKKITEVKSLSVEKQALLKNPELQQRSEGKVKVAAGQNPQSKPMKSEQHEKKMDRPPKVEEPTYLIMKFMKGSSLPSIVELKARFARFGPLDIKLSRVFYTTNTCRVAFLYKQDANVAYRYAMGSKSVFSNVKFSLKPVADLQQQPNGSNSSKVEELQGESAAIRDSSAAETRPVASTVTPQQLVPQLKSCLKKPSGGDETGGPNNGTARTARVRFNMGEVEGSTENRGGLQGLKMESRNSMLSSYEGPSSSPSSPCVAMDISNNQRFNISSHPLQPPLLPLPSLPPLPPQIIRAPINPQYHHHHHHHMVELSPRKNLHDNPKVVPPPPLPENQASPQPSQDISQLMMALLTRCHDAVTNVKSIFGYLPYHPI